MENKFRGDSYESAYHTMSQCFQCAGNEAKLAKYEEELKTVKVRLSKHKEQRQRPSGTKKRKRRRHEIKRRKTTR
jgi:hypothetical protein